MTFKQLQRLIFSMTTTWTNLRCQLDGCFQDVFIPRIARSHPHTHNGIIKLERQHCHCWVNLSPLNRFFFELLTFCSAGIVGLNVALVLAERGYGQSITVIAEYLPGDTSVTYTSPW